ncbi:DNA polymerase III subunit beta [Paenibacillus alvei]|uniref:Beta sliding clamp n=1 Tax=Paenibacillus alvei TaxID=44250 RepID=A0ABT4E5Z2_PAEAL|nr:DNA polymerase III subunit beta [Paenibacillus alvei]MCY9529153.1 DNA polymerase III subunit beta [Paenibacillus alvei]
MKLSAKKNELIKAIRCMTFPKSKLLIEATDSAVKLSSSDDTVVIKSQVDADVHQSGKCCVSTPIILEILSKLRGDVVELGVKENKICIKGHGKQSIVVATLDVDSFPFQLNEPDSWYFTISTEVMKRAFKKTSHSITVEKVANALKGLRIKADGSTVTFTGCDTKQFAMYSTEIPSEEHFEAIIPKEHLKLVENILIEKEISFTVSNNFGVFATENHILYTRLIDEKYPPAQALLDKSLKCQVQVDTSELIKSIELAEITANKESKGVKAVKIKTVDGGIEVVARNELGNTTDFISAETNGEEITNVYDSSYLIHALKAADMSSVKLGFVDKNAPLIINGESGSFVVGAVLTREVS